MIGLITEQASERVLHNEVPHDNGTHARKEGEIGKQLRRRACRRIGSAALYVRERALCATTCMFEYLTLH
jgi:hypothetical protein